MNKYTVIYMKGLVTKFIHVEASEAVGKAIETVLLKHDIVLNQVWFILDGHCQLASGWEDPNAQV
jgi:hypothetical protein